MLPAISTINYEHIEKDSFRSHFQSDSTVIDQHNALSLFPLSLFLSLYTEYPRPQGAGHIVLIYRHRKFWYRFSLSCTQQHNPCRCNAGRSIHSVCSGHNTHTPTHSSTMCVLSMYSCALNGFKLKSEYMRDLRLLTEITANMSLSNKTKLKNSPLKRSVHTNETERKITK